MLQVQALRLFVPGQLSDDQNDMLNALILFVDHKVTHLPPPTWQQKIQHPFSWELTKPQEY